MELARKKKELIRMQQQVSEQIAVLQESIAAAKDELDQLSQMEDLRQPIARAANPKLPDPGGPIQCQSQTRNLQKIKKGEMKPEPNVFDGEGEASALDEVWELRLYVAGITPKSIEAFANLKKICEEPLAGKYYIEVADLLERPKLAKGDQILAIPTLVRLQPAPLKKIIGDLSDTERVLVGLDLRPVRSKLPGPAGP